MILIEEQFVGEQIETERISVYRDHEPLSFWKDLSQEHTEEVP